MCGSFRPIPSGKGRLRAGASSATGTPLRVMKTSSPSRTSSRSLEKCVLASWTLLGRHSLLSPFLGLSQRCCHGLLRRALFSTDTGDAWLLDPQDHLAARLAREGDPEEVYCEETDTRFAIGWKGEYRIDGDAFVYIDRDSGRMVTILGYPIRRIAKWADWKISNIFGLVFSFRGLF